jgi:hypothetical protein
LNQFSGWINEKLGKATRKVILLRPLDDELDKFVVAGQYYYSAGQKILSIKKHKFVLNPKDWLYQRGQTFVQFQEYGKAKRIFGFYNKEEMHSAPNIIYTSEELDANRAAETAKAAAAGGQLSAGLIMLILALGGGIAIGAVIVMVAYPQIFPQMMRQTASTVKVLLLGA